MAKAKSMSRSRNQLATAYAPESFFTFEGGVGACISHAMPGESAALLDTTKRTIVERLEQFCTAWLDAAMRARSNDDDQNAKFPVLPPMCVEESLLDETGQRIRFPGVDRLYFSKPSNMGYTPAPLTFTCRNCGLFREFASIGEMSKRLNGLQEQDCTKARTPNGKCSWEQLDVIFVHWSGGWAPPSPHLWDFRNGAVVRNWTQCASCGSEDFRLNRDSPKIGEWYFACAKCSTRRDVRWLQRDHDTLEILRTPIGQGRLAGPTEVNMEAIPYRASNAYHLQSELFIDFKDDGELTRLLSRDAEEKLRDFIAQTYGFEAAPTTDADVESVCLDRPECEADLAAFRSANATIATVSPLIATADAAMSPVLEMALKSAQNSRAQVLSKLRDRRMLLPKVELPLELSRQINMRRELYAPRYDPIQLSVEHAMLKRARLDVNETIGGKRRYVSFKRLDNDLSPESLDETAALERAARDRLARLGVADMGLIREFDLCRFSFGYTRISAGPVLFGKRFMNMPVRLRLFPKVSNDEVKKNPIYVIQQANQAIYVKLDEQRVTNWLQTLGCRDMFTLALGQSAGAGILGTTIPMDRFLENLPRGNGPPYSYQYLYTLLHSYAHLVMKQVSEYSGLDIGSLGEYLFPADLAFVIYRNGTTMDLGNLSAMWRNSGCALLDSLLSPRSTQCGTGSLCTTRGGACPDCLMIPETSCIAGNKLISRSVLRSIGGRPSFDTRVDATCGYLD